MHKFFIVFLLFLPSTTWGATILFEGVPAPRVGDTFTVPVSLRADESINAFEGSVLFPDSLDLVAVRHEGSVVPLWVTPPHDAGGGVVMFAGVMPGGYQGATPGNVFTLVFVAKSEGVAPLSFGKSTAVYLNDGAGSPGELSTADISVLVGSAGSVQRAPTFVDTLPPEPFVLALEPGESFGVPGPVLLWSAIDKGSGVQRSEVCIGFRSCVEATSPHMLGGGDTRSLIRVRVTDKEGNSASAHLFTFEAMLWHVGLGLATILAGVVCFVLFRLRRHVF